MERHFTNCITRRIKKMKLIDADQKIFVPIEDEQIGASYEMEMTIMEFFGKFFDGFQPTVIEKIE
jgi:hypothetical protein